MIIDCEQATTVAIPLSAGFGTSITGADAINSALYFPWVRAPDPQGSGALREFPPCGFVAGICSRIDAARGVWKSPAGIEASLRGASGPTILMSDAENDQLTPRAINCLRTFSTYGTVVWGARTLYGANERGSEWKYIAVRRMALFLEETLIRGTKWVAFERNDEPLWAQIRLSIGAFLHGLFKQGAFQGQTPREAYFVKCDRETTTQADASIGIVNIDVGFAPLKPAEFVVIHIRQVAGEPPT
jgi:phage tail sheath protein FI